MSTEFSDQNATLANWICGSIALAILIARLIGHRWQRCRFDLTGYVVIASVVVLVVRMSCNEVVLRNKSIRGDPHDSTSRRTGSVVLLIVRLLVATFYYLQCILLLLFYREMLDHITWISRTIKFSWCVLAATYIAVVLTTFLECRPIHLYWTLHPDQPHKCTRAYGQLYSQCLSLALIDTFLLIISAPILRAQIRQFPRNLQLGVLYALGFFSLIIIGFRLHFIQKDRSAQRARSFWASIQVVTSSFVANAPSIYGALKNVRRGRKESVVSFERARTRESSGGEESSGGGGEAGLEKLPAALIRV